MVKKQLREVHCFTITCKQTYGFWVLSTNKSQVSLIKFSKIEKFCLKYCITSPLNILLLQTALFQNNSFVSIPQLEVKTYLLVIIFSAKSNMIAAFQNKKNWFSKDVFLSIKKIFQRMKLDALFIKRVTSEKP